MFLFENYGEKALHTDEVLTTLYTWREGDIKKAYTAVILAVKLTAHHYERTSDVVHDVLEITGRSPPVQNV